ncbi:MAG: hypothetical protein ABSE73_30135 [Planctomycetota bacterium]
MARPYYPGKGTLLNLSRKEVEERKEEATAGGVYDLDHMLQEMQEDTAPEPARVSKRLSQKEINQLIAARRAQDPRRKKPPA